MVDQIEEYDIKADSWNILTLKNPSFWIPVEICASIQYDEHRMLVFGGSDAQILDSDLSYLFDTRDSSFEKTSNLRKGQVFTAMPFCYGGNVFVVGNEYYVKTRNLHRFDKDSKTWDLIF